MSRPCERCPNAALTMSQSAFLPLKQPVASPCLSEIAPVSAAADRPSEASATTASTMKILRNMTVLPQRRRSFPAQTFLCRSPRCQWVGTGGSVAGDAVDAFAQQVGMAVVPRVLLDHVHIDPPDVAGPLRVVAAARHDVVQ